ncbi:serine/threonine protein kinase [Nocardia sp. NPDC058518]|uniref:serine/threonine protein kinase n=1 Tax=Nocardia sp. NPDC058518 TaxID=3346534 RepID=UPI0036593CA0
MTLQPGDEFAEYTIEGILGVGGMGVVYLARHPRIKERRVALKVLADVLAGNAAAREAFDREVALAAKLEHPNIVTIHDRNKTGDPALWLSMRHIRGGDAKALLADSPQGLSPELVMRLLSDAADALDYAHHRGILHRDVKPANLLIEHASDGGLRAVLGDFGIARALDETATASAIAVTFAYAAPERFLGGPVDHRADIYSLGCSLHELLTGQTPYPLSAQAAVMGAHLTADPPSPHSIRPDLPAALDDVIAKVLAKSPDDRYASCTELIEAARRSLAGVADRPGSGGDTDSPKAAPAAVEPKPCVAGTTRVPTDAAAGSPVYALRLDVDDHHRPLRARAQPIATAGVNEHTEALPPTSSVGPAGADSMRFRRGMHSAKFPVDPRNLGPMQTRALVDRQVDIGRAFAWVLGAALIVVVAVILGQMNDTNASGGRMPSTSSTNQALDQAPTSTRTAVPSTKSPDRSSSDATTTRRTTTSASATSVISRSEPVTTTRPAERPRPPAWVGECIALNADGNLNNVVPDCERGGGPYQVSARIYPDDPDQECPDSSSATLAEDGVMLCLNIFLLANYCYSMPSSSDIIIIAVSCPSGDFVVLRTTRSVSGCGADASMSFRNSSVIYCIRNL